MKARSTLFRAIVANTCTRKIFPRENRVAATGERTGGHQARGRRIHSWSASAVPDPVLTDNPVMPFVVLTPRLSRLCLRYFSGRCAMNTERNALARSSQAANPGVRTGRREAPTRRGGVVCSDFAGGQGPAPAFRPAVRLTDGRASSAAAQSPQPLRSARVVVEGQPLPGVFPDESRAKVPEGTLHPRGKRTPYRAAQITPLATGIIHRLRFGAAWSYHSGLLRCSVPGRWDKGSFHVSYVIAISSLIMLQSGSAAAG